MIVYALSAGFTLWMAVEAVRRGHAQGWLWIILFFPPLGALVFFFAVYLDRPFGVVPFRPRRVTSHEVKAAAAEVRRLDNAASWVQYASLLRARGEFTKAVDAAQKALERAPGDIDARYELGRALLGAARPAEAVGPLEAVVAHDPAFDKDDALVALSQAREASGDLAGARASLEDLARKSSRPEILHHLATLQARAGDREAAAGSLQRILDEADYVPPYLRGSVRPWVRRAQKDLKRLKG